VRHCIVDGSLVLDDLPHARLMSQPYSIELLMGILGKRLFNLFDN
jgi:hypothetical protein